MRIGSVLVHIIIVGGKISCARNTRVPCLRLLLQVV
jgi:hypothetical protein